MRALLLAIVLLLPGLALAARNPAETVPFDHWAYDAVQQLRSDAAARPASAAVAVQEEPFSDVPRSHWAFGAVEKLRLAGIVIGYPEGTFSTPAPRGPAQSAPAHRRMNPAETVPFDY
jgi:S-layer homology domain